MNKKIALIGAGNIGGTLANLISIKQLVKEIVLLDVSEGMAKGKALDIAQANAVIGSTVKILGTSNYKDIVDSDVIIITAGVARKPGMTRDDLLSINAKIIKEVSLNIKNYAPEAFVIVVTNPLDATVWLVHQVTGFSPNKIVGMAGILDGARFTQALSETLNVGVNSINTLVVGAHGDTMVPLPSYTSIAGIALTELVQLNLINESQVTEIINKTKTGGAEIVRLMQTGSAFYAPAAAAVKMAEAYLNDQKSLLVCSACLNGQYGIDSIYLGVPVIIGSKGVEKVIELNLQPEEAIAFENSAKSVLELIEAVKQFL